ncbi:MAG: hypothetical protein CBD16_08675 [Betaproteobacteria bacterium TMED156]|nr:MAG: hypothetical protein CBD16_08675 [Betaproteobacteria bacterium TMED156]
MTKYFFTFLKKLFSLKSIINNLKIQLVLKLLKGVDYGQLVLLTPEGNLIKFSGKKNPEVVHAELNLYTWNALNVALLKGDVGFAEAFMENQWSTKNLANLFEFVSLNRNSLSKVIGGNKLFLIYEWITHKLRFNSQRNARSNIKAHYDLSNEFYKLFLDSTMTYSSAYYGDTKRLSLEEAQIKKMTEAFLSIEANKKELSVLEIGFGWGGFAKQLLENTYSNYYGITLSTNQHEFAKSFLSREVSNKRAKLEILDYRNLVGKFDAIVSIEMFEAVGQAYWKKYFSTLKKHLKPNGKALIQTILIDESKYKEYCNGVDFIKTYIFPGGMLATEKIFKSLATEANFNISKELWFNKDYAKTLHEWQNLFEKNINKIERLGFDFKFCNMWRFYLAYCEAGFRTGDLKVVQFTLKN